MSKVKYGLTLGKIMKSNNYGGYSVVSMKNNKEILIRFCNTGSYSCVLAGNARAGMVRDYHKPSVCGVGYLGEGLHKSSSDSKKTDHYSAWSNMIQRCYNEKYKDSHTTYLNASVDKKWHNFQVFSDWYLHQKSKLKVGVVYSVDKDILINGNKLYSEDTCCLVPNRINSLLVFCDKTRGLLPVGVTKGRKDGIYEAKLSNCGKHSRVGSYKTPEIAFHMYKTEREKCIALSAKEAYKSNEISEEVYNALLSFHIDIRR